MIKEITIKIPPKMDQYLEKFILRHGGTKENALRILAFSTLVLGGYSK